MLNDVKHGVSVSINGFYPRAGILRVFSFFLFKIQLRMTVKFGVFVNNPNKCVQSSKFKGHSRYNFELKIKKAFEVHARGFYKKSSKNLNHRTSPSRGDVQSACSANNHMTLSTTIPKHTDSVSNIRQDVKYAKVTWDFFFCNSLLRFSRQA